MFDQVREHVDAAAGRVIYHVAMVGAFTVELDDRYPSNASGVHVRYGAYTGGWVSLREALPDDPVIYGVQPPRSSCRGSSLFSAAAVAQQGAVDRQPRFEGEREDVFAGDDRVAAGEGEQHRGGGAVAEVC